jgi:hypothetical protein
LAALGSVLVLALCVGIVEVAGPDQVTYALPKGYDAALTVCATGGDYTKLSDALDSITDASPTKRYIVQVIGGIDDDTTINGKSYVDVYGYGADVVVDTNANVRGLSIVDVVESTWQDLTFRRRGAITSNIDCGFVGGDDTDSSFRMRNCRFINETSGVNDCGGLQIGGGSPILEDCYGKGADGNYAWGIWFQGNPTATLINCIGEGGGGNYCYGICCHDNSCPTLIGCIGRGGTGTGGGNHGFQIEYTSAPVLNGCVGYGGPNSDANRAFNITDSASPTVNGCVGQPEVTPHSYEYGLSSDGKFRAYTGRPYQLVAIRLIVVTAAPIGTTLDLGTATGGSQVAADIPLDSTGWKVFDYNQAEVATGGYLYATPSQVIPNSTFIIQYTVVPNYDGCYGLAQHSSGFVRVANSRFAGNGASDGGYINSNAMAANNFAFTNCTFETMDTDGSQYALRATSVGEAKIEGCSYIGGICNVIPEGFRLVVMDN